MRKIALLLASLGLCLVGLDLQAAAKIKVLLITGDDVTPAHNWKEMSSATREVLEIAEEELQNSEVAVCNQN